MTKHSEWKVVEKIFKKNRWHVRLESDGRVSIMPYANYVWLKGNPAFKSIPKGYVIHHLDHDSLNDDISNLVIMQKHHHTAYHWKNKKLDPKINIKVEYQSVERNVYYPVTTPRIHQRKDTGKFYISFYEIVNEKRKQIKVYKYNGKRFVTRDDAKKALSNILN